VCNRGFIKKIQYGASFNSAVVYELSKTPAKMAAVTENVVIKTKDSKKVHFIDFKHSRTSVFYQYVLLPELYIKVNLFLLLSHDFATSHLSRGAQQRQYNTVI